MKKTYSVYFFLVFFCQHIVAQNNIKYVTTSQLQYSNKSISVIKLSVNDSAIKVNYFTNKYLGEESASKQFRNWSKNKNVLFFTSANYVSDPFSEYIRPVGLCINKGQVLNYNLSLGNLHGLVLITETGKIFVHNLKNAVLNIKNSNGKNIEFDLSNSMQRNQFFEWAIAEKLTVFQTHLFLYKNEILTSRDLTDTRPRRFLISGTDDSSNKSHYMMYIPTSSTINSAVDLVIGFLRDYEDLKNIDFIINLDSGIHNIFGHFKAKNQLDNRSLFKGTITLESAPNLLVYYVD
ncbi:hypothetical protein SKC37_00380 [Aquirufa sp. HETE-83D]|uniref:Phosphodiester glycosidase domain-containing protein n=1 Tax=Aquirufa esocilacus TaxID=3096513 RepID=A0ABW6DMY4_9BACT